MRAAKDDPGTLLISVTGADKPGITSRLTGILAEHDIPIRDMEQVTSGGNLTLSILIDAADEPHHPFYKDFIFAAWELGVHADFRPSPRTHHDKPSAESTYAMTLFGDEISARIISEVTRVLADEGMNIDRIHQLSDNRFSCIEMILSSTQPVAPGHLKRLLLPHSRAHEVNLALQRENVYRRVKRLIVFDMDSTLVQGEVIDALARRAGVGAQVEAVTRRAMAGRLDFEASLRRRVGLLKGLREADLSAVREGMELTPGAYEVITVLKRLGYRIGVISGGFSYFTDWLKRRLGLDYAYGNVLEMVDGVVTGRVKGEVIDAERKGDLLEHIASLESISLDQVIAVGDGANDLKMLERAGLGIAFNAKAAVRDAADHAINGPHLHAILYLLGLREHELRALLADDSASRGSRI